MCIKKVEPPIDYEVDLEDKPYYVEDEIMLNKIKKKKKKQNDKK